MKPARCSYWKQVLMVLDGALGISLAAEAFGGYEPVCIGRHAWTGGAQSGRAAHRGRRGAHQQTN
jgi:hypothetical protein